MICLGARTGEQRVVLHIVLRIARMAPPTTDGFPSWSSYIGVNLLLGKAPKSVVKEPP